jgi:hypothetical protein
MMFVNISPAIYNVNETLCSLNFASRCRNIELGQAKRQNGQHSSAKDPQSPQMAISQNSEAVEKPNRKPTDAGSVSSASIRSPVNRKNTINNFECK